MDAMLLMIVAAAGAIALGWSARRPHVGLFGKALAGFGILWLGVYFIALTARTDPTSVFVWYGDAEMGPITLFLICLSFTWLWLGSRHDVFSF